jgi:hypothetical protein
MEDTRFDDMVKALGAPMSRRLTLGALLGGHGLGRLNPAETERRGAHWLRAHDLDAGDQPMAMGA